MYFYYKRLHEDAQEPTRATIDSAGYDVYAVKDTTIPPLTTVSVCLGIAVTPPIGYYLRITNRSSMALNENVVVNADVVDPDYTGELHVIILNSHPVYFYHINKGDRIGQIVFTAFVSPKAIETDNLPITR